MLIIVTEMNQSVAIKKNQLPFEYMPDIDPVHLSQIKSTLTKKVQKMFEKKNFLQCLQKELVRFSLYTTRLNVEEFQGVYNTFKDSFQVFFGNLSSAKLFAFLDQDSYSYLHFDEQMQIFTMSLAICYHMLEEANFYGLYDLIPLLRSMIDSFIDVTTELEKSLRAKFYQEANNKFRKGKDNRLSSMFKDGQNELATFGESEIHKWNHFGNFESKMRVQEVDLFNKKKTHLFLNKFCQTKNSMLQEKLLGLQGRSEEAKNTLRNYNKFWSADQKNTSTKVNSVYQNVHSYFSHKVELKKILLVDKIEKEKERIRLTHEHRKNLAEKNLNVVEIKIKTKQVKETSNSNYLFSRICYINLMKSEASMKRDFSNKIEYSLKSIFQAEKNNSFVFKMVFEFKKLSLFFVQTEKQWLENLDLIRNGYFNVRLAIHDPDKERSQRGSGGNENGFRERVNLCALYDQNLNLI